MAEVIIFVPNLEGGGMERVAVDLANSMSAAGVGVELVVACAKGPYRGDVLPFVHLVDLERGRIRSAVLPLTRHLRRSPPRALLAVGFHANVAAWFARRLSRRPMRLVISEHGLLGLSLPGFGFLGQLVRRKVVTFAYGRADAVVAVSAEVKRDLTGVVGRKLAPVTVIHNPVRLANIRRRSTEPAVHPWFSERNPPIIISVGRLEILKDHATLIRAFGRVRASLLARLVIVGEGSQRATLEHLVRDLGLGEDVSMPGFSSNPYAMMARARMLVLSSQREGLGVVLIEALALALPIVSTDCPGGPSGVLGRGAYGLLVPVGDPIAMSGAMTAVLEGRNPTPPIEVADEYDSAVVSARYLTVLGVTGH